MRKSRITLFILLFIFALTIQTIYLSKAQGRRTIVIRVEGTIDAGYADVISRTISDLPITTDRIIIVLNTNGGYLSATEIIVDSLFDSTVPVTVYVPPSGRAFSAGAYIALASHELIMARSSVIGSAEPRTITGATDPKVVNAMETWIRAIAKERGRNETMASMMVKENIDLTGEEAYRLGVSDVIINSFNDLLEYYRIDPSGIEEREKDVRASLLSIVSDPFIVGLLIDLSALLILIEIFHPTYLGGIASGAVLILALLGMGMIGINSAALFLLLIGAMAILLEIKYGHGELAVGGAIVTLFAILLMYQREYFIWSLNYRSMLLGGAVLLLTTIGVVGFYLQKIREVLMKKEKMHEISLLIGKTGIVRRHISPAKPGVVLVASDLWTATADEEIPANAKVRVISVDGLVLKVERVE